MRLFQVFNQALRYFMHNPMLIVTFIGVAFIPILYSGFLIRGTWDPYGQLGNLPVAVVNKDLGADFQGKTMNIGQDFIDELKKNNSFAWNFVDEQEASRGMKGNHYYAEITIPPGFSQDVASLTSDNPKQAEIVFESNSYYNFVAGQISENATRELKDKLSHNLTETYSRSIYTQFESLSNGLSAASEGAAQLNAGAVQLDEGIGRIKTNLSKLADGADKLDNNVGLLLKGSEQLTTGIQSAVTGSKQLNTGLSTSIKAFGALSDGSAQVAVGLKKAMDSNADLAADPQLQKLLDASQAVAKGASELQDGQKKLLAGSESLARGVEQVSIGADQLHSGLVKLAGGIHGTASGAKQLDAGTTSLREGASNLAGGTMGLAGKLNEAAQKTSTVKANDQMIRMLAQPVTIKTNNERKVTLYGNGIAPYLFNGFICRCSSVYDSHFCSEHCCGWGGKNPVIRK